MAASIVVEERGPLLCLMGAVDDATGELLQGAHFVAQECAAGYLRVLQAIVASQGAAVERVHGPALQPDTQRRALERSAGARGTGATQVGRALAALEIEPDPARSPQAKGRVERLWGTLRSRLTAELRLNDARTLAQANAVLERCIPTQPPFRVPAARRKAAWRPLHQMELERVCSFGYSHGVNDNTVRLSGVVIDIPPGPQAPVSTGAGRGPPTARRELAGILPRPLNRHGPQTAGGELRALKGRYHWAPPAAQPAAPNGPPPPPRAHPVELACGAAPGAPRPAAR